MLPTRGRILIAYHYPCPDGVFAALAAYQHFSSKGCDNLRFFPNRVFAPCTVEDMQLTVIFPFSVLTETDSIVALYAHMMATLRSPTMQADDTLYLLDYVGPPGFAIAASKHAKK